MSDQRQTLITGFFDLPGRDARARQNLGVYLEHGRYVLGLDLPVVAFVDPELAGWVRRFSDKAEIVPIALEDLDTYRLLDDISGLDAFRNADPQKDTPLYQILNWAKFELIEAAIAADPFRTEHFAWIDFGITHVARLPHAFPEPSGDVALLEMRAVAPSEIADRGDFYAWERGRIGAGLIRGSRPCLKDLAEAFREELNLALASGWRVNEQQVLSYLSATQPDRFAPYYGDYSSTLCNWDFVRDGLGTVFQNLRHCRDHGLWGRARDICEVVERSIDAGTLNISSTDDAWLQAYVSTMPD